VNKIPQIENVEIKPKVIVKISFLML